MSTEDRPGGRATPRLRAFAFATLISLLSTGCGLAEFAQSPEATRIGGTGPGGDPTRCLDGPMPHGSEVELPVTAGSTQDPDPEVVSVEAATPNTTSQLRARVARKTVREGNAPDVVVVLRAVEVDGPSRTEQFRVRFGITTLKGGGRVQDSIECLITVVHTDVAVSTAATPAPTVTSGPTAPVATPTSAPTTAATVAVTTAPERATPAPQTTAPPKPTSTSVSTLTPTAAPPRTPTPTPAAVSAYYRTYNTSATFSRDDCGYSPGQATVTIAGNADGSGATITVRLPHPPDANARSYTGSIKPDGSFTGTGSGAYQQNYPSNWTGSISGTATSAGVTATEDMTMAANSWCTAGQRKIVIQHVAS
jgi:hypothetical protein